MRLRRIWDRLRGVERPREIAGFRFQYGEDRRLFATAGDGSRWETQPGTRFAKLDPPANINLNCSRELICEGIEGVEMEALLEYGDDRSLTLRLTDGETWQLEPGMHGRVRGRITLNPETATLLEDGPPAPHPDPPDPASSETKGE